MLVCVGIFLLRFISFLKRHFDSWDSMGRDIPFYNHITIFDFWATYVQIILSAVGGVGVLIRKRFGWVMVVFSLYSYWGSALGVSLWASKNIIEYIFSVLASLIIFAIIFLLVSNNEAKNYFKLIEVRIFSKYVLAPLIAGIICGLFVEIGKFYI